MQVSLEKSIKSAENIVLTLSRKRIVISNEGASTYLNIPEL